MMKPSYFVTPRSMSEGVWIYNSDPIEKPDHMVHHGQAMFVGAAVVMAIISSLIVVFA